MESVIDTLSWFHDDDETAITTVSVISDPYPLIVQSGWGNSSTTISSITCVSIICKQNEEIIHNFPIKYLTEIC